MLDLVVAFVKSILGKFDNEQPLVRAVRSFVLGAVSIGITAIVNALASGELAPPAEAVWIVPAVTAALLGLDKLVRRA